jgi:hypothetical protein
VGINTTERGNKDNLNIWKLGMDEFAKLVSVHSLDASFGAMCTVVLRHELQRQKKTYAVGGASLDE